MEIGTYIEHSVDHDLSGNIIDLVRRSANSKPFRYRGAAGNDAVSVDLAHDGVGTQIYVMSARTPDARGTQAV